MLHILTALYRFEFLDEIYSSIPPNKDITWHLACSVERGLPNNDFLSTDKRIKTYLIDCKDSDTFSKRNFVFGEIHDGYFFLLDDDTLFHRSVYDTYRKYAEREFRGMIVGHQIFNNDSGDKITRKPPFPRNDPELTTLDTGVVIAHYTALKEVKWKETPAGARYGRDFLFWSNCLVYFGKEHAVRTREFISFYNHFDPAFFYVSRKYFGRSFRVPIKNKQLALLLFFILDTKRYIRIATSFKFNS